MEHISTFQVFYKSSPHRTLRQVTAQHATAGEAIKEVEEMLTEDGEAYFKPILAMLVGGKQP